MNFHVRIVTIALTTLLLLGAVFVWMTVLDKGTVEVMAWVGTNGANSSGPYQLSFQGKTLKGGKTVECVKNPCTAKLPTGAYGLTVTQEGYFDEVTSVEVVRGEKAKLEVTLQFIPTVAAVSESYEELRAVFEREDMSNRFRFGMDTKYKKQRLTYRDEMVWAYFDRSLTSPAVFPDAALTRALAVDRSDGSTYAIDLEPSRRTWVGVFEGLEEVLWVGQGSWVLMKTGEGLQWVKVGEGAAGVAEVREWPFKVRFDQIVAESGLEARVVFLTTADLLSLESSSGVPSTLEVVKNLLNGKIEGNREKSTLPISLVEYRPEENRYRVLHTLAVDLELTEENARLAYDGKRWLVGNGERAWEIQL